MSARTLFKLGAFRVRVPDAPRVPPVRPDIGIFRGRNELRNVIEARAGQRAVNSGLNWDVHARTGDGPDVETLAHLMEQRARPYTDAVLPEMPTGIGSILTRPARRVNEAKRINRLTGTIDREIAGARNQLWDQIEPSRVKSDALIESPAILRAGRNDPNLQTAIRHRQLYSSAQEKALSDWRNTVDPELEQLLGRRLADKAVAPEVPSEFTWRDYMHEYAADPTFRRIGRALKGLGIGAGLGYGVRQAVDWANRPTPQAPSPAPWQVDPRASLSPVTDRRYR